MRHFRRPSPAAILASVFVLLGCVWGGFLGWRQIVGVSSPLDRLGYLTVDWQFHHQQITATGDTVNVTTRLLEVAKQERSNLVVSQDLYAVAAASGAHASGAEDAAREVRIRGRLEPLNIRVWPQ